MSIDHANHIINEQEDAIAALKHDVLDREDQRDLLKDRLLECKKALRRIECAEDLQTAQDIAGGLLLKLPI